VFFRWTRAACNLAIFIALRVFEMAPNIAILRRISELVFSSRSRAWIFGLLLAGVTIFVYRPAWNGGFLWDDDDYIIKNDLLTASDGLRRIWFSLYQSLKQMLKHNSSGNQLSWQPDHRLPD